ncbi:MAG: bacillithiol biosynthesis BshC [Planctomycetota bacterium]
MALDVATIPYSRLDPGNGLARRYLTEPDRVLPLFAHDYRDPRALRAFADECLSAKSRLAGALEKYNADVGGDADAARRVEGGGLCVISGQQAGLLYGPAYTTYKLLTVINLARVLTAELREPVTPVFWVESEDHDWAEVNRFFLGERRFALQADVPAGTPVSDIEADPASLLAELREALGDGDAWSLVEPEANVARWHVRNLARLVAGRGVVFVEPRMLREPMRDLAEDIAKKSEAIDEALRRDTGFEPALSAPGGAYLFSGEGGVRRRLARGDSVPDAWSTDVVSRVLVQNAAFRPLAAVCGPGEIRYWAQLKPVHELFGVPMPAVVPRDAATLIEPSASRDAAKLGLALDDVVSGETTRPESAAAADPLSERLRGLADEAKKLFGAVDDGSLDLPGDAQKPFRRTVGRLEEDLAKLAGRIDAARAEQKGVGKKRYDKLLAALRPRGRLQERSQSIFPALLRHGPGLVDELLRSFDPYEFGHYLVML